MPRKAERGGTLKEARENTLLVLTRSILARDREEMRGIARAAHDAGWRLTTVEYGSATASRFHGLKSGDMPDLAALARLWRPAAVIVECGGEESGLRLDSLRGIPVVLLDAPDGALASLPPGPAGIVSSDADSIAEHAARELILPEVADYAYVPWLRDTAWSRARGEAFARLVALNRRAFHSFPAQDGESLAEWEGRLAGWLRRLPRPVGVFAANDYVAERVVGAAARIGMAVPDDAAVVGVDNDEELCERAAVSLSSVATANERAGALAVRLALKMASGSGGLSATFGAARLARRASSRHLAVQDFRVRKGLEQIRREATRGLTAGEVAKTMGCSRRWAEMRFRAVTGKSILEEIHDVRFARARDLLANGDMTLAEVAAECGYASSAFFRHAFARRTGMTPKKAREAALKERARSHEPQ